ncbi:MAG: phosphoribosyltransferase [Candidatus Nanohaloarchaea archaeon]|nr:phosphoribosyltransferase [Candidatus Nanohaloarchaea archaeon]
MATAPDLADEDIARLANTVFSRAKSELDPAYHSDTSDEAAVATYEDDGRPLLHYLHGEADLPDMEEYEDDYDLEAIQEAGGRISNSDYRIEPGSEELDDFYDEIRETFDEDEYDTVIGIYGSGIPPLYVATDHLDADEVVMRYSHYSRHDQDVSITETWDERAELDGDDVLIVDDVIASGKTVGTVAQEVYGRGADNVHAASVRGGDDFPGKGDVLAVNHQPENFLKRIWDAVRGFEVSITSNAFGDITGIDVQTGIGKKAGGMRLQQVDLDG